MKQTARDMRDEPDVAEHAAHHKQIGAGQKKRADPSVRDALETESFAELPCGANRHSGKHDRKHRLIRLMPENRDERQQQERRQRRLDDVVAAAVAASASMYGPANRSRRARARNA